MKRRLASKIVKKDSPGEIFYRESTFSKAADKTDKWDVHFAIRIELELYHHK